MKRTLLAIVALLFSLTAAHAAEPAAKTITVKTVRGTRVVPAPTLSGIAYGTHPRHVVHFWKVDSDKPTPLLFFIHGGGWTGGSPMDARFCDLLPHMLEAGISVTSIQYRLIQHATADKVVPPVKACFHDAARALQFVRSKAGAWNIDKARIGLAGGSAGACSSLWLAYHDDLADPKSEDPVARESTRVLCAAVGVPQTTLDPQQMKEWTPNSRYGGHAFGFQGDRAKQLSQFDEFLANRERILPWIAEYSPYALVSPDDPPVYLSFWSPPALGQNEKDPTHTSNFGVKLQEHCRSMNVSCEVFYSGAPNVKHATVHDFLIKMLKAPESTRSHDGRLP